MIAFIINLMHLIILETFPYSINNYSKYRILPIPLLLHFLRLLILSNQTG